MIERAIFLKRGWVVPGAWAIALACVALSALVSGDRLGPNLLLTGVFLAGLGAGALFFLAVNVVAGARWDESLRPLPSALTRLLPLATLLLALALWVRPQILPFPSAEASGLPAAWLTRECLLMRLIAYAVLWSIGARLLQGSRPSQGIAAAVLVMLALTGWLAASDWLMSLTPGWTSTIYGIYVFIGFVVSALAAILLSCVLERIRQPESAQITDAQLHDLATLLFGLSCVWMYLWYSQYMLIWYTNQPHETGYYVLRTGREWRECFWATVALMWAAPFALLLSRAGKCNLWVLALATASVLAGQWLDLYVTIFAATSPASPAPGLTEVAFVAALIVAVSAHLPSRLRDWAARLPRSAGGDDAPQSRDVSRSPRCP
jgi:hypothetical protein